MNDLIYIGSVLVGATTLLIEAFRNFNSQTGNHPFSLHPILRDVEVRNLCTTGEVIAGFAFYSAMYLIVYTVVLGSAEIYQLLVSASNARNEIGATDNVLAVTDPSLLSATNYGKPIFVSALLISFLSIGAVKPIEATMRGLAHRLAGIPRGVYKVIESLRDVSYTEFIERQPGPLVMAFHEATASLFKDGQLDPRFRLIRSEYSSIEDSLATIDYLAVATNDTNRMLYFPLYQISELTSLSSKLETELAALRTAIGELATEIKASAPLSDGTPDIDTQKLWGLFSNLGGLSANTRSNTMAVFAVFFVRNNRSVFSQGNLLTRKVTGSGPARTPMEKTVRRIQERYNSEQNAFGISLFVAVIVGAILTFTLYDQWTGWKAAGNESLYSEELASAKRDFDSAKKTCTRPRADCEKAEAISRYRASQRDNLVKFAVWDTVHSGLIVLLGVFFVLIGREVRIEQQSWRTEWRFYHFPFLALLSMSFMSGLIAVFASAAVRFLQLGWDVGFRLTQTQIIDLFEQSGVFFAFQFGSGLILAFAALVIMDKHRQLRLMATIAISLLFGAIYVVYTRIVIFISYEGAASTPPGVPFSLEFRDTIMLSTVPLLFMILFAILLETTEAGDRLVEPEAAR
ncbi:hypothetical protein SAMN02745157_4960 [Kaistia soli DSM 19436]|uniref:Uncharacterized protein n=1 Tax=Kaistia soli DSM 19436 TaxID=1122133 RepID=A0A1M5NA19_9HYPH|nr:hypothetical protein [Kaistia soli]SHG86292.1 hypothetical protein SAMN02745157_4960 [Kaistia soli DSM 19436]